MIIQNITALYFNEPLKNGTMGTSLGHTKIVSLYDTLVILMLFWRNTINVQNVFSILPSF
jgi:hypothetical protein